MIYRVGVIYI